MSKLISLILGYVLTFLIIMAYYKINNLRTPSYIIVSITAPELKIISDCLNQTPSMELTTFFFSELEHPKIKFTNKIIISIFFILSFIK